MINLAIDKFIKYLEKIFYAVGLILAIVFLIV